MYQGSKRAAFALRIVLLLAFSVCMLTSCDWLGKKNRNAKTDEEIPPTLTQLQNALKATLDSEHYCIDCVIKTQWENRSALPVYTVRNTSTTQYVHQEDVAYLRTQDDYGKDEKYYYRYEGHDYIYMYHQSSFVITGPGSTPQKPKPISREVRPGEEDRYTEELFAAYVPNVEELTDEEEATFNRTIEKGVSTITYEVTISDKLIAGEVTIEDGLITSITAHFSGTRSKEVTDVTVTVEYGVQSIVLPAGIKTDKDKEEPKEESDDEQEDSLVETGIPADKELFGNKVPVTYTDEEFTRLIFGNLTAEGIGILAQNGWSVRISEDVEGGPSESLLIENWGSVYHYYHLDTEGTSDGYLFEDAGKYYQTVVTGDQIIQMEIDEESYRNSVMTLEKPWDQILAADPDVVEIRAISETIDGAISIKYKKVTRVNVYEDESDPEKVTGTKKVTTWGMAQLKYDDGNVSYMTISECDGKDVDTFEVGFGTDLIVSQTIPEPTMNIDAFFGDAETDTLTRAEFGALVLGKTTEEEISALFNGNIIIVASSVNAQNEHVTAYFERYGDVSHALTETSGDSSLDEAEAYWWIENGRYYCGTYVSGCFVTMEIEEKKYNSLFEEPDIFTVLFFSNDSEQTLKTVVREKNELEDGSVVQCVLYRDADGTTGIITSKFDPNGDIESLVLYTLIIQQGESMSVSISFDVAPIEIPGRDTE